MDTNQDTAVVANGGGFGDIWMGKIHEGTKVAIKSWRGSLIEQYNYKTLKVLSHYLNHYVYCLTIIYPTDGSNSVLLARFTFGQKCGIRTFTD
jgi:hypothetical protein